MCIEVGKYSVWGIFDLVKKFVCIGVVGELRLF